MLTRLLTLLMALWTSFPALAHEADHHHRGTGETCPIPVDDWPDWWNDPERYAWSQICIGAIANMAYFTWDETDPYARALTDDGAGCTAFEPLAKTDDPETEINEVTTLKDLPAWPETRHLSPRFIKQITTRTPWTEAPARPATRFECAELTAPLTLADEVLPQTLWLDNSRLTPGVTLINAQLGRDLSFDGSHLGRLRAWNLHVAGNWFLRKAHLPRVDAIGAKIGGSVSAIGSTFTGLFSADGMEVGGSLFLQQMPSVAEVRLLGAKIGGVVAANGSTFTGLFNADGMEVGGSLFLQQMPSVAEVRLLGAKIGGSVSGIGSTFIGLFNADRMEVGGSLFLRQMPSVEEVRLLGAKIGGNVEANGSTFTGLFRADGMEVGGDLFLQQMPSVAEVRLLGAKIGGVVAANGSTFTGLFNADRMEVGGELYLRQMDGLADVDLPSAKIGGNFQLTLTTVSGAVNLTGAEIVGSLELWQGAGREVAWGEGARLVLRNATVGALQARMPESWQPVGGAVTDQVPVDLNGFRYDRLGGLRSGADHDAAVIRDAGPYIDWVERAQVGAAVGYAPQPYLQLASTLRGMGAEQAADQVDYARYEHRRAMRAPGTFAWPAREGFFPGFPWDQIIPFLRHCVVWALDTLAWIFVGHGVYPQRAVYWFLGLVALGTLLGRVSPSLKGRSALERLWYSLETALPLIELSEEHKAMTHTTSWGRRHWTANYYHFQKVAGFGLATVLVGALTILGG